MMKPGYLYLEKFKILGRLGQGNFGGMVYRARNLMAGREVALKIFPRTEDPESHDRLRAEHEGARLQQLLSGDPRVTQVYEFGLDPDGDLFVEMEHVEGENLSTHIARHPLSPREAMHYAAELAGMLDHFAHFRGEDLKLREVFHGDLKPQNIRITPDGRVKVFDFGIAKAVSATRSATGQSFASPAYSSPEFLLTNRADATLDRWALGVTLYQMVSGGLPFDGAKAEIVERRIRSGPPAPITGCPPPLMSIIFRMLAQDPGQRYPSASAIAAALRDVPLAAAAGAGGPASLRPSLPHSGGSPLAATMGRMAPVEPSLPPSGGSPLSATVGRSAPVEPSLPHNGGSPFTAANRTGPPFDFDAEATRRTAPAGPPMLDPEATQRTTAPARALSARPSAFAAHPLLRFGWKWPTAGIVTLSLLAFLWSQRTVYAASGELRHRLDAASSTDLEQAWQEYQSLESRRVFPFLTWSLQSSLKERLIAEGSRVIDEYHSARSPVVRRPRWERASLLLDHALVLDAGNGDIKARKKVVDGYLRRIDAQGLKAAGEREAAITDAETHFKEAAALTSGWVDPWLALMTVYAYDRRNVEQTDAALAEARKRGRAESTREVILQADVRYYAVPAMAKQVTSFSGGGEQAQRLNNKIIEYCRRGIELYGQTLAQNPPPRDARKNLDELREFETAAEARQSAWSLIQP